MTWNLHIQDRVFDRHECLYFLNLYYNLTSIILSVGNVLVDNETSMVNFVNPFLELGIYIKHILSSVSIDTYSCSKPQSTQQQASERNKTE